MDLDVVLWILEESIELVEEGLLLDVVVSVLGYAAGQAGVQLVNMLHELVVLIVVLEVLLDEHYVTLHFLHH